MLRDSKYKLVGSITTESLLFSDNNIKLRNLFKPSGFVNTTTNNEEAAQAFAEYDQSTLPVVNTSKTVIGIITADDIIDVVVEAATEDFEKMAGIDKNDDAPYSKASVWSLFKSRIVWLLLLMISATLSQIVLDSFQGFASDALENGGGISNLYRNMDNCNCCHTSCYIWCCR